MTSYDRPEGISRRPSDASKVGHQTHGNPNKDSKGCRGHDSDAVRILEQAFQHTPNITQAEKYRLAEVTGLRPKQVTVWFQNRRNRKGKKGRKAPQPTSPRASTPPQSPDALVSPPRDFTLNEKKRKSYGALGVSSSLSSDSDSDDGLGHLKKPRLPRSHSGFSDSSASSSIAHSASFTAWSSPSSRSTSSSTVSSSPSDCFDSPSKPHNIFRPLNPLKYDARATQDMPAVTIATPVCLPCQRNEERSPFTSDRVHSGVYGSSQGSGGEGMQSGMDFGNLGFDSDALSRDLRETIQKALEMSAFSGVAQRNASDSSWSSMVTSATDDDGWVDEDEPTSKSAPQLGIAGMIDPALQREDASQLLPSAHGMQLVGQAASSAPVLPSTRTVVPWASQAGPEPNGNMACNSTPSHTHNDEDIDLNHFFELASHTAPASTFLPYQHSSLVQPLPGAAADANACLDFEVEMADLEDYLNTAFVQPPMPVQGATAGHGVQGSQAEMGAAAYYLNFDLSPNMFCVA